MSKETGFEIVECSGTPFEMGRQYGSQCRDSVVKSVDHLVKGINARTPASEQEILATAGKYLPIVEQFDPEQIEFLRGQAEGAGLSFEQVFALKCWFELSIYYQFVSAFCTSFAVGGRATKDGLTIIGQNFDLTVGLTVDLVKMRHASGLEQLSLVFFGGCELTLSSAGLAMALNVMLGPGREQRLVVPSCAVITRAMRQQRIGDAVGVVCSSGRSILHYLFADAEGSMIGIETKPDDYNVLYPRRDFLVHANHYLTDRLKSSDGTFGLMEGDSHIRVQRLRRRIEEHYGELTPELMMEFLADHNNYPNSICAHFNTEMPRGETLASVIMVPAQKLAYVTRGQPCCNDYQVVSL